MKPETLNAIADTGFSDEDLEYFSKAAKELSGASTLDISNAAAFISGFAGTGANITDDKSEKYVSLDDVYEILTSLHFDTNAILKAISQKAISAVDGGHLQNWYIDSIPEYAGDTESDSAVWTMGHIKELVCDFALLPREDDNFSGNGYAKRYEEKQENGEDNTACPKSNRCIFGSKCPYSYEPPDKWYGCFTRGRPKTKLEDFSRAELIAVIKFAMDYSPAVKSTLEKAAMQLGKTPERKV